MICRVNLACGPVFVDNHDWLNFDYQSFHQAVREANLLQGVPLPDNSCDLVYSSHFLEHIPISLVPVFLSECYRILKPGGVLRLVVPDFEEMCREYLHQREKGEHEKADFLVVEIIDQCVRMVPGGELGRIYRDLSRNPKDNATQIAYIKQRSGEVLSTGQSYVGGNVSTILIPSRRFSHSDFLRPLSLVNQILRSAKTAFVSLKQRLTRRYFRWLLARLPVAFREQNVSRIPIGERHHWLWDFNQLKTYLGSAGYIYIQRQSHVTSLVEDFPFFPLDIDNEGLPRKGEQSMYIEARKPF